MQPNNNVIEQGKEIAQHVHNAVKYMATRATRT